MERRILLVEGANDFHVLCALFERHNVPASFEIVEAGGVDPLWEEMVVRLTKQSDLTHLAVVLDADEDAYAKWRLLDFRLKKADLGSLPGSPDSGGTVVTLTSGIRFGAWIMPDNKTSGMLEDFVAFLVPDDDDMLPRVEEFLDSIPPEQRLFGDDYRRSKARIHTWLAIQKEPGKPMGQAITARYLDADKETVTPFLEWIETALVN